MSTRRRSRAARRGGVIIESLVVIPLFIILCTMGFWAFRLHHEKLAQLRSLRQPVWTAAIGGCPGGSKPTIVPPVPGGDLTIIPQTIHVAPNEEILVRPLTITSGTDSRKVSGEAVLGTGEQTFQTQAKMMCNESVEDGHLALMRFAAARSFP